MSYTLHIWDGPVPPTYEEANRILRQLLRSRPTETTNPKYVEAAKQLTSRYPFTMNPHMSVDGEVWSDGPLVPQTGRPLWGVGILFQHVKEVAPFVISTSNKLGLVVYDIQVSQVYLPDGRVLSIAQPAATRHKPNRKLAMLVLFLMGISSFVFFVLGIWATFEICRLFATGNATMPQDSRLFVAAAIVFLIAAAPFVLSWVAMRLAKKAYIQINKKLQSHYD